MEDEGSYSFKAIIFIEYQNIFQNNFLILSDYQSKCIFTIQNCISRTRLIPSNKKIELDFANKPSLTAEIYPNNNKGRILLCSAHPEYMIWWGGKIEEEDDSGFNCLADGLHRWKDIASLTKTLEDELTHTWWIVRRIVAWTAKVQDNHLPPICKGKITEKVKPIISENIFWDGSLINQMKNI